MEPVALFSALLMGVVEGLTEFLPISSTGHLILLGDLIGFRGPPGKAFVVSIALIVGGVVIILIEWLRPRPSIESVPEIGPVAAVLIGFGQVLAMVPGTSRSGATIIAALLIGVDRRTAAEFSFILAIPTMLAATVFSLFKARNEITPEGFDLIAVGFLTAFVVALVTVRTVLAVISRTGFAPFGWYRIALGGLMLAV